MIDKAQQLLTEVGQGMARAAGSGWSKVELHATAAGGMTETTLDVHRPDSSIDTSASLDRQGRVATHELREAMYQQGKGTWYNARLTLDPDGKFDADFDYENPPFEGDADDALLRDDQEAFPRDPEQLPSWHPSSGSGTHSQN